MALILHVKVSLFANPANRVNEVQVRDITVN